MSDYFGKEVPKLGFGLMRLPKKGLHTDIEQVKHMVDLFMEAGFTYFDTAYVYMGSEAAIKKALVERYPRESFTLATKPNKPLQGKNKYRRFECRKHPLLKIPECCIYFNADILEELVLAMINKELMMRGEAAG